MDKKEYSRPAIHHICWVLLSGSSSRYGSFLKIYIELWLPISEATQSLLVMKCEENE